MLFNMNDLEIPIGKRTKTYRFLERMPAIMSWMVLLTPVFLAIINPILSAYFVLIFMAQYLLKAGVMSTRVVAGYKKMKQREKYDWSQLLDDLQDPQAALSRLKDETPTKEKVWHYNNLHDLMDSGQEFISTSQMYHVVIVAIYNESIDVLRPTIKHLAESDYDQSKVIVYVAYEERGGAATKKTVEAVEKEFADSFFFYKNVMHPDGLPNEVIGKGGNITYAARDFYEFMQRQKMNPDHVLVTTLDADNRVHKNYLSSVAYAYMVQPDRQHHSYQPIPMYLNNLWYTSAPARMIATGNSFWWTIQSTRPYQLQNFSSHAQPMSALIDTDFWSTRTVVEDGHQYWRTYFRYNGKHSVVPTFVPIFQDAVRGDNYKETLRAQFLQMRRWAYGASDIPYVTTQIFFGSGDTPKFNAILKLLRLIESHVTRAASSLILAGAAWMPILASPNSRQNIVALQLPGIAALLQTVAMLGVPVMLYLSFRILPDRPKHFGFWRYGFMLAQWALLPPLAIFYGSLTAIDAQTRLFTGKYLEKFDVTVKVVAKQNKVE